MSQILLKDVQDAETFLATYLQERIPEADFSAGSALRDFAVKAIAHTFAYLRAELAKVRKASSLLTATQLDNQAEIDEAVDAILANWFVTRLPGKKATVPVVLHFSQPTSVSISKATRFNRSAGIVFHVDTPDILVIPAANMSPVFNSAGVLVDYTVSVNMIAAAEGTAYNIEAGRFVSADTFSPFFRYAENTVRAKPGAGPESTEALIARAPNAISVRNLVNQRSIDAVLRERYPEARRVLATGYGDPEMLRDLAGESLTQGQMHVGGATDIYVDLPVSEYTETLTIGGAHTRPDNSIVYLRDSAGFAGVTPGMVVQIKGGLTEAGRSFIIVAVGADYLEVHTRTPFSEASDEASGLVSYSVGTLAPGFDNILPLRLAGETSRKIVVPNAVVLSGRPHYAVKSLSVVDETPIFLSERVNGLPTNTQYSVTTTNPASANSGNALTIVQVHSDYAGLPLRIVYDTTKGLEAIHNFVTDTQNRVLCASTLVRGLHPVYVSLNLRCQTRVGKVAPAPSKIVAAIEDYINVFDNNNVLDISTVQGHVFLLFPELASVTLTQTPQYTLYGPDGQMYVFKGERITTQPSWAEEIRLTNGASLRTPILNADLLPVGEAQEALRTLADSTVKQTMFSLGVSDRLLRSIAGSITVTVV